MSPSKSLSLILAGAAVWTTSAMTFQSHAEADLLAAEADADEAESQPPPQSFSCQKPPADKKGKHGKHHKALVRRAAQADKELLPGLTDLGDDQETQEKYDYDSPKPRSLPEWFDITSGRNNRTRSFGHDATKAKGMDSELWSYPIGNYSFLDSTEDWRSAIDGVQCSGKACQFMSVHFQAGRNLSTEDPDHYTNWFGRRSHRMYEGQCAPGRVVAGIQCRGDDCSRMRLACAVPKSFEVSDNYLEMGTFSSSCEKEEVSTCGGFEKGTYLNYVLRGIRCTTATCSKKRLLCARVKEPKVDCTWGDWSLFSPCSKTCGGGWMWRVRSMLVKPSWDGVQCVGSNKEKEQCGITECPGP